MIGATVAPTDLTTGAQDAAAVVTSSSRQALKRQVDEAPGDEGADGTGGGRVDNLAHRVEDSAELSPASRGQRQPVDQEEQQQAPNHCGQCQVANEEEQQQACYHGLDRPEDRRERRGAGRHHGEWGAPEYEVET